MTNKVKFVWMPGYSCIKENEIAVELAKQGANCRFYKPEPIVGVSKAQIKAKP